MQNRKCGAARFAVCKLTKYRNLKDEWKPASAAEETPLRRLFFMPERTGSGSGWRPRPVGLLLQNQGAEAFFGVTGQHPAGTGGEALAQKRAAA